MQSVLAPVRLYAEDFLPMAAVLVILCLLEDILPRAFGFRSRFLHKLLKLLFACYLLVLFQMTISLESLRLSAQAGWEIQGTQMLTPFREIMNIWRCGSRAEILRNLAGNVVVFIPMGLFPCLLWKWSRNPWLFLLWAIVPSCFIELLQLFTPRCTSVDDLILNAFGAFLGYLLFRILYRCGLGRKTLFYKASASSGKTPNP